MWAKWIGDVLGGIFNSIWSAISMERTRLKAQRAAELEKQLEGIKEADERARADRAALTAAMKEPEVSDDDWNNAV